MRLVLKKFQPDSMKEHRITLLLGKRGTGKSVLLRDILYEHRKRFDIGICFSPTYESTECFKKFVPQTLLYGNFQPEVIAKVIAQQRARCDQGKPMKRVFIVLDDCGYDKNTLFSSKNTAMREIFMNGRHLKITLYIALQYCVDMPSSLRSQVDYVMTLREPVLANIKRLHDFFFGIVPSLSDFKKVLSNSTENHEALVTTNLVNSNDIADCVFWYKAKLNLPDFKLCQPCYWELSKKLFITNQQRLERSLKEEMQRAKMTMDVGIVEVAKADENDSQSHKMLLSRNSS